MQQFCLIWHVIRNDRIKMMILPSNDTTGKTRCATVGTGQKHRTFSWNDTQQIIMQSELSAKHRKMPPINCPTNVTSSSVHNRDPPITTQLNS